MKIRSVHIENFRAIDQLDLDFGGLNGKTLDLAVLAGPNGCGKTSVLEACLLALRKETLLPERPGRPRQDYVIDLRLEGMSDNLLDGLSGTFHVRKTPREHLVGHTREAMKPVSPSNGILGGLKAFYFTSWRAPKLVGPVELTTGVGKPMKKTAENALKLVKQRFVNAQGLKGFKTGQAQGVDVELMFSRLNSAWHLFYPELNGAFAAEVLQTLGEDVLFDLLLRDAKRRGGIAVDHLSSGEIEVFTMLGMLVIEKNPFEIVFVDEPELHLHPAWHRAILPALRKVAPDTQFICATHSQDILDSVYSFQRFTLLPEGDPRLGVAGAQNAVREVTE